MTMAQPARIGIIYEGRQLGPSAHEQLVGARLAADLTRELRLTLSPALEVVERQLTDASPSVAGAAGDLIRNAGCRALVGILPVPLSIQAAAWAEAAGVLYVTANNNPQLRDGRRRVFHIGVPSEVTAAAAVSYLSGERGAERLAILHPSGSFQVHAAECVRGSAEERGLEVHVRQLGQRPAADVRMLEEMWAWRPDAVCVTGGGLERLAALVTRMGGADGGRAVFLGGRGMICREFVQRCGEAAEGYNFIDLYLRDERAPEAERHLMGRLEAAGSGLVATASHGFGWDCMRLAAEAFQQAGPDTDEMVAYLEGLDAYSGATGTLSFSVDDHNGRWRYDPTTIARLSGGQFTVVSTLAR